MRTYPITLVVSADRHLRQVIVDGLDELGCAAYVAASHADALTYAARMSVDVAVVDVDGPAAMGSNTIRELRSHHPHLRVVYLMGSMNAARERGLSAGVHDTYLRKPFRLDELCDIVSTWLAHRAALHAATCLSIN